MDYKNLVFRGMVFWGVGFWKKKLLSKTIHKTRTAQIIMSFILRALFKKHWGTSWFLSVIRVQGQHGRLPGGFFGLTALLNWVQKCFVKKGRFVFVGTNMRECRVYKGNKEWQNRTKRAVMVPLGPGSYRFR